MTTLGAPTTVEEFRVEVPGTAVDDLRARLAHVRWPDPAPTPGHGQGVSLDLLRDVAEYWRTDYRIDAAAERLNAWPQYRTTLDGLGIHFLHVRSPHPGAVPLLLTHGWPDTPAGFSDVIGALTDPDDPADAFHVVAPSLPGHGFSDRPDVPGWDVERTAAAWDALMGRLGYDRYGAHGGDWGSFVTGVLGATVPDRLVGVHLTMPLAGKPEDDVELDERDQRAMQRMIGYGQNRSAYAAVQSSRPQTLAYGLTDSPVALLAWFLERYLEWTDHDGDVFSAVPIDRFLDVVTVYWITATGGSSARLFHEAFSSTPTDPVTVPAGCSVFPNDAWMPRAWIERRFTDVRHWRDLDSGGHFPAVERPHVLVDELRTFFRGLRGTSPR